MTTRVGILQDVRKAVGGPGAVVALALLLLSLACLDRAGADTVKGCGDSQHVAALGTVLSVRNMSCAAAARVLGHEHALYNTPIGLGAKAKIGGFRCHVYEDDTPPGPSDVDEKLRCVHGRKAFRYRYAV